MALPRPAATGPLADPLIMLDAAGNLVPVDPPRALTLLEIARLRRLGLQPRAECATRHYEFGCRCEACAARQAHVQAYGYDRQGKLNVKPQPRQPWETAWKPASSH